MRESLGALKHFLKLAGHDAKKASKFVIGKAKINPKTASAIGGAAAGLALSKNLNDDDQDDDNVPEYLRGC